MSVEKEALELRPNCLEYDGQSQWYLIRRWSGGSDERHPIPQAFNPLLDLQSRGASLSVMAGWLKSVSVPTGRFRLLADFLLYLYENDLLVSVKAVELAEALRCDSQWNNSLLNTPLAELELVRLPARKPRSSSLQFITLAFVICAICGVVGATSGKLSANDWGGDLSDTTPLVTILTLALVFSVSRSCRSLIQLALFFFMTSFPAALRIRLEALSLNFSTDDVSLVRQPSGFFVLSSALALLTLGAPFLGFAFWPQSMNFQISIFCYLILFADLSPFRRGPLTEVLRIWYSWMDRRRQLSGAQNQIAEIWLSRTHNLLGSLWCGALLGFLFFPFRGALQEPSWQSPSRWFFFTVVIVIVASFVAEIAGYLSDTPVDLAMVRRLWRRRPSAVPAIDDHQPRVSDLEKLPLLRQMSAEVRRVMLSEKNARILDVDPGQYVIREGQTDRKLYVVLSGRLAVLKKVEVRRPDGRGDTSEASARKELVGRKPRLVTYLEPGAVFGEVSFFLGAPRTASIKAIESSRVLQIRHDARISDLDSSRSQELQLRIWFLAAMTKSDWFKDLPPEAMDALVFAGQRCEVRAGQKIITEGEAADSCYFLIEGRATATQNFKAINRLKPGDVFGEIALLEHGLLRTATVVADTPLLTVKVDGDKFWALLCNHLPLAVEFEKLSILRRSADVIRARQS